MQLRCAALLFDLDGVLVDSRAVVERVCRSWALCHKLDPDEVIRIAHGRRARDTVKAVAPHLDIAREVEWIDSAELADVDGLREVPGVRDFLATLQPGTWAVVTSCGPDLAKLRLTSVGLPLPKVIVTSEDVSLGKPAAEGYELGAKRLGHEPAKCVVFEDAPPGIAAGRAAGARVVALSTTNPDADFSGADAIVPDFTRLRARHNRDGYIVTMP